ncbi:TRAP transporter small permease subunit [Rhodovulum sp. DZ06]|uniref:TRAP transporter small permease subunit n=1 Tax=Rhodovulum sp. DZ06 TaxID=3425126 RepID=UPI003D32D1BD
MQEHERTGPVDLATWGFSRVAMWVPAFIVGIIFYEVVLRYVFVAPTLWVNEMSLWAAGAVYLTAGLYAMQQRSHIRIFIIYDMLPRPLQKACDVLSLLCLLIFVAAVLYGGYGEAWTKLMRWETFGTAWDPPIPATIKPLILVTLSVLGAQAISNLIYDWNRAPEHHDPADELDLTEELKAEQRRAAQARGEDG